MEQRRGEQHDVADFGAGDANREIAVFLWVIVAVQAVFKAAFERVFSVCWQHQIHRAADPPYLMHVPVDITAAAQSHVPRAGEFQFFWKRLDQLAIGPSKLVFVV